MHRFDRGFRRLGMTAIVFCCLCFAIAEAAGDNTSFTAALESIQTEQLKQHVDYLADDEREGREAGSPGGRQAGDYLAEKLANLGLTAAGVDGGFFQPFGSDFRNVLGLLEGSDPDLKQEFIIAGAHYDHIGYGNSVNSRGPVGQIHNGADDNASGTSGILELAEAFTILSEPPKRSIVFVFWDAEERGMAGAKHWLAHPTLPLERGIALFNIDMIGRLREDRLTVFGTRTGYGLRRLLSRHNRGPGLSLNFSWAMTTSADHYPFFEHGTPVLFFNTGMHDEYHRPSDDADLIDAPGMRRVVLLVFSALYDLANREQVTGFREAARAESPETQRSLGARQPSIPLRLGATWDREQPAGPGIRLSAISEGSSAEKAAIKSGDRIVKLADQEILSSDDLTGAVIAAKNPVPVVIQRDGQEEPLELTVQLDGEPLRLGITWRVDDAEPGTVVLTRVVPGSPAGVAGLETGDRIYQIAGRDFDDDTQFAELAGTLPVPLKLLVERHGKLRTVLIHLDPQPLKRAA